MGETNNRVINDKREFMSIVWVLVSNNKWEGETREILRIAQDQPQANQSTNCLSMPGQCRVSTLHLLRPGHDEAAGKPKTLETANCRFKNQRLTLQ